MPIESLSHSLPFAPSDPKAALAQLPSTAAVFALYGAEAHAEPYIGRTPNLRGRLERLLQPSARHPRRLQLAGLVRQIHWQASGSEFESLLKQFALLEEVYGANALERMHLGHPAFVRFHGANAYPRISVTHRSNLRESGWFYGPFASRAAAERFAEEMLKLFLLRRCTDELNPDPQHPGCVYSEMKMCLAPCYQGCTEERYAEEAKSVQRFLETRGASRLISIQSERDAASANLEFEQAAALHATLQRVESVRSLASELVQPLHQLRAAILQASAEPNEVAVFTFENGCLRGPVAFSTLGMRIPNEQSGSTSLFAHPMAILPTLETQPGASVSEAAAPEVPEALDAFAKVTRGVLASRMDTALATLGTALPQPSAHLRQGHLALLKRWYYRPEANRAGEIFFPDGKGCWPIKAMLRGAGRIAAKRLVSDA